MGEFGESDNWQAFLSLSPLAFVPERGHNTFRVSDFYPPQSRGTWLGFPLRSPRAFFINTKHLTIEKH